MLTRRRFLGGVAGSTLAPLAQANAKGPNLVYFFPDQFRRQAVGCMGEDPTITPNLNRFASDSLVFTNNVSSYPVCSPYRGMLMTGKYPHKTGLTTNCNSATPAELGRAERCLTDVLHESGYSVGYVGKWHLDHPHEPYVGRRRGDGKVWDEFVPPDRRHGITFWHAYNCRDQHLHPRYWTTNATRDKPVYFNEWSTRHEVDVAIDYIRNRNGKQRNPKQPFALFVAPNPPHTPFDQVPPEYVERYGGKTWRDLLNRPNVDRDNPNPTAAKYVKDYFAAVTGTDEQFGRLLACLDEEGLRDNTIVVFTSDHGEMMGSHGLMHKGVPYEEAIGTPFLIAWRGRIRPGKDDLLQCPVDIMPSLLGLMGMKGRIPPDVQGSDYSGLLLGRAGRRPSSVPYLEAGGLRGLRTDRYTFFLQRRGQRWQDTLFDDRKDPYQLENIADRFPGIADGFRAEMREIAARTGEPLRP